tara:strand:+ start:3984 stop:4334 length:351 start_codon:yes stop_codon:yes gene_type:complete
MPIKHLLFSYGTLQLEQVQQQTYGRLLTGSKDTLQGYKLDKLEIIDHEVLKTSNQQFHPIAIKTGKPTDCVNGRIFELTEQELLDTDKYEVADYTRVLETFLSGKKAWIYISEQHS